MTLRQRLAKADFVAALVIIALGAAVIALSLGMPRYEERNVNPYSVPGLVPGLIGAVVALLGTVLLVRAAREGGHRLAERSTALLPILLGPESRANLPLLLVLTVGYAGFLVGWIPFWLATALFVLLFIPLFERDLVRSRADLARRFAIAAVMAGVTAAAVTYVFQEIFLVQLP